MAIHHPARLRLHGNLHLPPRHDLSHTAYLPLLIPPPIPAHPTHPHIPLRATVSRNKIFHGGLSISSQARPPPSPAPIVPLFSASPVTMSTENGTTVPDAAQHAELPADPKGKGKGTAAEEEPVDQSMDSDSDDDDEVRP